MSNRPSLAGRALPSVALASLLLAQPALAGPDWDEPTSTDAGNSASTAQVITTDGSISTIRGKLGGSGLLAGDFQDLFVVKITDPGAFSISTLSADGGFTTFNPMLFVFRYGGSGDDAKARAILGNDDFFAGSNAARVESRANDGSGAAITEAGLYIIGISAFASVPTNSFGEPLFGSNLFTPGVIAGPAGGLNDLTLGGWTDATEGGEYIIRITGAAGVPAPGALAVLALAGLAGRRRR